MKKLILLLFFIGCAAPKSFQTDSIKDGLSLIKEYQFELIRIDTLKNRAFIFYYKDFPNDD